MFGECSCKFNQLWFYGLSIEMIITESKYFYMVGFLIDWKLYSIRLTSDQSDLSKVFRKADIPRF